MAAAPGTVQIRLGAPTRVWRYSAELLKGPADTLQSIAGSYLGPTIRLRRGQKVRTRFTNHLDVMPGERVHLLVQFRQYTGLFLYHCHILEDEDLGMMRNFRVT